MRVTLKSTSSDTPPNNSGAAGSFLTPRIDILTQHVLSFFDSAKTIDQNAVRAIAVVIRPENTGFKHQQIFTAKVLIR